WLSLLGSGVRGVQLLTVAWFGPKGFASVVYGLLIWAAAIPDGDLVFALVATTTAISIVAHSSTDVVVARWFQRAAGEDGNAFPEAGSGPS
ncbi:MAG: cation:proton antiporter, partial [Acidimicrobiales bacterium]